MNNAQKKKHNAAQIAARNELSTLIVDFVAANEADSWKGGGDGRDVPLIEAELEVAHLKLERALDRLFPLED